MPKTFTYFSYFQTYKTNQPFDNVKNNQFEDVLIYFSKSLMGKENEDDILWDVAKNCIGQLGFVDCVIYLVDDNKEYLIQKAAYGPKNPKDKTIYNPVKIPMGQGISGYVAQTAQAEIIHDASKDPRYIEDDEARLSEICVPITCEDIVYGVIDCEHPEIGFFTDHHLKMLSAFAAICGIKIRSVRTHEALMEEHDRLIKIKEEMVELKLKSLSSQLNPHFVFNSLNSIQYFITSEKKRLALEYLSMFSRLIRFYLNQLGQETVHLKDEIDMLHSYLKLQKLRYDGLFDYNISLHENSKKLEEATIPSLVVQTLFENIIENAMYNQQKGQHFNVLLKVADSSVTLKVLHQSLQTGKSTNNQSGYRESILQWRDQINLLNAVKDFKITTTITHSFDNNIQKRSISLKLPNLI